MNKVSYIFITQHIRRYVLGLRFSKLVELANKN